MTADLRNADASGTPADTPDAIPGLRARIDEIDATVVSLMAERAALSSRVQAARVGAGGVRVELGRERSVREVYRDGLGEDGTALADAILRLCRGAL